jgi:hypothetical protein
MQIIGQLILSRRAVFFRFVLAIHLERISSAVTKAGKESIDSPSQIWNQRPEAISRLPQTERSGLSPERNA